MILVSIYIHSYINNHIKIIPYLYLIILCLRTFVNPIKEVLALLQMVMNFQDPFYSYFYIIITNIINKILITFL